MSNSPLSWMVFFVGDDVREEPLEHFRRECLLEDFLSLSQGKVARLPSTAYVIGPTPSPYRNTGEHEETEEGYSQEITSEGYPEEMGVVTGTSGPGQNHGCLSQEFGR